MNTLAKKTAVALLLISFILPGLVFAQDNTSSDAFVDRAFDTLGTNPSSDTAGDDAFVESALTAPSTSSGGANRGGAATEESQTFIERSMRAASVVPAIGLMADFIFGKEPGVVSNSCNLFSDFVGCFSLILSYLASLTGSLTALAAWVLDLVAKVSLDGTIYSNDAIKTSWAVLRDVVNIIFIFLILYIGIQTILGLSGGGTQKNLINIILVALLINFSLVATGVIIDASNVLALSFYDAFPPTNCLTGKALEGTRSLSCPFAQAAGLNEFLGPKLMAEWQGSTYGVSAFASGALAISGLFVLRIVVNVIAAFVLFAAAILFTLRTGILLFLMILAPLAAAAWALPKTQKYSKDWFGRLLNQAFFAPLFLLLYYVAARIYVSPIYSETFTNVSDFGILPPLIMKFAITIIFLVATIVVSKKLGAHGSDYVKGLGDSMKDRARSGALQRTAPLARRVETSNSIFARGLRAIPLVNRATSSYAQAARSDVDAREAELKKLDSVSLKNRISSRFTTLAERNAMVNILAERGDLSQTVGEGDNLPERFKRADIDRVRERQASIGAGKAAKTIKQVAWQYADTAQRRLESLEKLPSSAAEKLNKDFFALPKDVGPQDQVLQEQIHAKMQSTFTGNHVRKLVERDDQKDTLHNFMTQMVDDAKKAGKNNNQDEFAEWLQKSRGNTSLATWARSNAGRDILTTYGIKK